MGMAISVAYTDPVQYRIGLNDKKIDVLIKAIGTPEDPLPASRGIR